VDPTRSADPADSTREQVHGMWASVAPNWGAHADYVDARGADVTAVMLDAVALRPGDRVLELACGPGSVGLAAATRVGPGGEVVLSDVAAPMVAVAEARAHASGLMNATGRVLDLEQIDEPDRSYDVVVCREGLMFAVDHARAAREIARVLRPGGRVAIAVWGPRARNPWLSIVFDAVGAQLGMEIPPAGIPGPFALDDADRLASLLAAAGLREVAVREVASPVHGAGFDEWWDRTTALAGPLAGMLAAIPEDDRAAIRARIEEAVAPYRTTSGLELPGVTLLATARAAS
jgi:ubiquinone/menaquinone biosynthesis C-methylase UbiE